MNAESVVWARQSAQAESAKLAGKQLWRISLASIFSSSYAT